MSEFSIAQAKAQFAELVHQAESGHSVRITRRGRPVAVLLSEAEFDRLSAPRQGFVAFAKAWRARAEAAGVPLFEEGELSGLRDQSDRTSPDWA